MWLIPPAYPVTAVLSIFLIYLYSIQQVCVSSLSDRARIAHRYLTSFYCLCLFILHLLFLCHFSNPQTEKYVISVRIMIGIVICIGAWLIYQFIIQSIHTFYSTAFMNNVSNEMPKWFRNVFNFITIINIVSAVF